MSTLTGIKYDHVISAINEVRKKGIPTNRNSKKFDLVYEGERYSPKYIIGIANKYANGFELLAMDHFGGAETNNLLKGLGFVVKSKLVGGLEFAVFLPEELPEKEVKSYIEGARKRIYVNAYERNPAARRDCLKHHGYNCAVCEFNFEDVFGEIGEEFIHVHHLKPLHELKEEYKVDPVNDLRPVCPNCHAMLHKREPTYTIEELRVKIKNY